MGTTSKDGLIHVKKFLEQHTHMDLIVFINKHIEQQNLLLVGDGDSPLPSGFDVVSSDVGIALIRICIFVQRWKRTQCHVALKSRTAEAIVACNDEITIAHQSERIHRIDTNATERFAEIPFIRFVGDGDETIHIIKSELIGIVSIIPNENG